MVSFGTDTVSCNTNMTSCGTDEVSHNTDAFTYGTNTANYGSSGKKGLPGLYSVVPFASNISVLCCTATRTVISALSYTLYNH